MTLTKYKDLIGLASADRMDPKNEKITNFMKKRGVDTNTYVPVGIATDYYSSKYHYAILCRNPDDPTNETLIKLQLYPEITKDEYDYLIDTYSSMVVYNHDIDPHRIKELKEVHLHLDEDE